MLRLPTPAIDYNFKGLLMKYTLIKGNYLVVGQSPDGDSVKFKATNPALWARIDTENRAIFDQKLAETGGIVMLRLQGVDALETHFSAPPIQTPTDLVTLTSATLVAPAALSAKQPAALAQLAAERLLAHIGITTVKWRRSGRATYVSEITYNGAVIKTSLQDNIPGYIVTGDVEQNGRPLSWVFAGNTSIDDGAEITTEQLASIAEQSANYQLLRQGVIYPLYFMTLAGKLREKLSKAVRESQSNAKRKPLATGAIASNLWHVDASTQGCTLTTLSVITDEKTVFPSMFRRIIKHQHRLNMESYWAGLRANAASISVPAFDFRGFFDNANPYVFVISDQDFLRLADVVETKGNTFKMLKAPHDLVFLS
jgi:hypothetical protein